MRDAVVQDGGRRRIARRARGTRRRCRSGHRRALHRPLRARSRGGRGPQPDRRRLRRKDRGRDRSGSHRARPSGVRRARRLPRRRRVSHAQSLRRRRAERRSGDRRAGELGAAGLRRRGVCGGPQVAHRACGKSTTDDGGQHRRGRTGYLQGPLLPRARSAPVPRRHADCRVGGRDRKYLRLPPRRIRGLPRIADARARRACPRSAVPVAADRAPARRRRVHLRRGIGDDRIDRGQARHAAPSPPVRRTGRSVRPADARTQHGNPVLGA